MKSVGVLLLPLSALGLVATALSTAPASSPARMPGVTTAPPGTPTARAVQRAAAVPRGSSRSPSPVVGVRWTWPLQPQPTVVRAFLRPATTYGAGHRGVDLAGDRGQEVRAVDSGVVTHVGRIAGRGTVSVLHASGIRSTYEPLDPAVAAGSTVVRGRLLGRLEETGSHCAPELCLHLGAVRDGTYLDPLRFLQGGQRVRLLPLAGQAPEG